MELRQECTVNERILKGECPSRVKFAHVEIEFPYRVNEHAYTTLEGAIRDLRRMGVDVTPDLVAELQKL